MRLKRTPRGRTKWGQLLWRRQLTWARRGIVTWLPAWASSRRPMWFDGG